MMVGKLRKQVIICPGSNQEQTVTYSVSGNWFSRKYDVVGCSTFKDGEVTCEKQCISLFGFIEAIRSCVVHKAG